jgi:hypothetical protein
LSVGDVLEAAIEKGKITLTPKSLIDRKIAKGIEDVKRGRVSGPFSSAAEVIQALHGTRRKGQKRSHTA